MKRPFLDYDAVNNVRHTPDPEGLFVALGVESLVWIPLVFGEQLTGMLTVQMSVNRQIR